MGNQEGAPLLLPNFWSGSGPGDQTTDRSESNLLIECALVASFRF